MKAMTTQFLERNMWIHSANCVPSNINC